MNAPLRARPVFVRPLETALELAIRTYVGRYGFTELRRAYQRIEGEVARDHRASLAGEGWIA